MEKESNKKKLFMIGMSVLLILVLVIGGTYAWFTLQLNGTKVNVLKAGTLSLILNDENSVGINSEKAVPMLDEVGEQLDPYHFTLENNSNVASDYTIYLDDVDLAENETRMNDSFVKYQLTKDGTKTTALLNTTGTHPNRILDSGTIAGNTTITYDLRLWIDSDATNDVMGTTLKTKLRVVATQSTNQAKTPNENILKVYRYSTDEATKCITGEETTCQEVIARSNDYEVGTIIKYKVNDTEEKYFHVISNNEDGTLTMQQRENTISATKWYDGSDDNTKGPLTILTALESATSGWTNVNDQKYTLGTTTFKENPFTGCNYDSTTQVVSCTENKYTMPERTAKARIITAQEAGGVGCKTSELSCPIWMNNYLDGSKGYGGTMTGTDYGYWTASAKTNNSTYSMYIAYQGQLSGVNTSYTNMGARAVVVIDK